MGSKYLYSRSFIEDVVEYFDKNSQFMLALQKWELIQFVANKKAKTLNSEIQLSMQNKSQNYAAYVLTYLMGRYFIVCTEWVKNGKTESKEEMITLLSYLNTFETT